MSKRIAVIGECMLELTRSTPAGTASNIPMIFSYGGDTLNTAVYMARQGVDVDYFTAIGDDPYSDWMMEQWQAENVGCSQVLQIAKRLPGIYSIETDSEGERRFFYWRDQSPARELFDDSNQRQKLFEQLLNYDLIYLSGITLSLYKVESLEALFSFLQGYREQGGKIAFDGNFRPTRWPDFEHAREIYTRMYKLTDIALPTFEDEQQLFLEEAANHTCTRLHQWGVAEMVVKQGDGGCIVSAGESYEQVPANAVDVIVDTTAAGDSFNAAYLTSRIYGQSCADAAVAGHNLAATVIQHQGAIIPR